jgi:hypothetical protein
LKYSIPITVGVVGHRDAIITREQELQITTLFHDLAARYPASPVWLFSSLAEGADREVAKLFLGLKETDADYKTRFHLLVPLPFTVGEFRKDFDNASAAEFDQILLKSERSFPIACEGDPEDRPQQYLRTGKFVADSSMILLALWDGMTGKKGGTADIVRHKIAGDDENVAESTFEYDGTVFVIPCSRAGSPEQVKSEGEPLSLSLVMKDIAIKEALDKTEEINSQKINIDDADLIRSQADLYGIPEILTGQQLSLLRWYSLFDTGSLRSRAMDIRITMLLFFFGFLFVVALQVYSNLFPTYQVLGIAMFLIVAATSVFFYSRTTRNHRRYLINRTFAEALRIKFYWSIAGINKNVSDFFLRIHRKDCTWVKHLLSAINGITYETRPITYEIISELTEIWIRAQASFFRISISKMRRHMAIFNVVSNASFIVAFALLISIFFFGQFYISNGFLNDLLVMIGTFLGFFALIKGYIQMKGYEQLMNQYELMSLIYARAESKIEETDTYNLTDDQRKAYLKELFFVVGKEALIENGNWYLIFKEKEPEIEGI